MASEEEVGRQIAEMSARIAALERAIGVLGGLSPAPPPPVTPPAPAIPANKERLEPRTSLESRIGGQILNRVGILAVLVGVAWFLKLAFDRNWIGPGVRILVGLLCAGALMAWSERFRRRGFPAFSYSLKALGTSIAYLALWAASSVYHLAPSWIVFLAMTAVTLANAGLAQRQNSELLAIYALAGGLATPALLSIGVGDQVFLFAYLVLLNAGSLFLLARRPWKRLAWLALLGTAAYYVGWGVVEHQASNFLLSALFLCLFFISFTVLPFLLKPISAERFFPIAFPVVNASATWLALSILADRQHHVPQLCLTVALALICLETARYGRERMVLSRTNLGLSIFFVTAACSLQFDDYQLTLCWLVEGLFLVALARAARENDALRIYALAVLVLAAAAILLGWTIGGSQPVAVIANMHFATSLVGAAVFATVVVLSLRAGVDKPRAFCGWRWLAGFAAIAFSLILLIAVSLEIHHYWFCGAGFFEDLCGRHDQGGYRAIAADFSLSGWWMLYGAALMTVGFLRRSAFLRWQALLLLALSIGKVFLNGVSLESQGLRVLSFLALGILLLAVSFAYQRNWLRLRD